MSAAPLPLATKTTDARPRVGRGNLVRLGAGRGALVLPTAGKRLRQGLD